MTHDVRFDDAANRFCAKDIKSINDCNEHKGERGTGHLVSCLYDSLANITESTCRNFIKRIQSVIFTDWRLSESFTTACSKDIADLECGRLDDDNETVCTNQTIRQRKIKFLFFSYHMIKALLFRVYQKVMKKYLKRV